MPEIQLINDSYAFGDGKHGGLFDFGDGDFRIKAGKIRLHTRPTGGSPWGYGIEIKSEPNVVSGTHFGVECTVDAKPNTATSQAGIRGLGGIARLKSGYTMTGGGLIGVYGQINNLGTINGAGSINAAGYFLIEAGGTWTAVSHLAGLWVDSHLAAAPSAGSLNMVYITNNADAQYDDVFYIYAGNKITNLFTIDTASGMVSDETDADYTFAHYVKIKCYAGGKTRYLIADADS